MDKTVKEQLWLLSIQFIKYCDKTAVKDAYKFGEWVCKSESFYKWMIWTYWTKTENVYDTNSDNARDPNNWKMELR